MTVASRGMKYLGCGLVLTLLAVSPSEAMKAYVLSRGAEKISIIDPGVGVPARPRAARMRCHAPSVIDPSLTSDRRPNMPTVPATQISVLWNSSQPRTMSAYRPSHVSPTATGREWMSMT